jgi:lipoic acid synthetase/lipoate-protein ligase A
MLMVEHALRKLGVDARTTGRNDILVGGKKVSGNAFYHLPQRSIVHGTLLYDTNLEHMVRATTPSDAKLKSKGVQSVRQHVTTLNSHIAVSIDELKHSLRTSLCDDEIMLSANDIEAIETIERGYYKPSFIYGNRNRTHADEGVIVKNRRIEGVGEFNVNMTLDGDIISDINIAGDFFVIGDLDSMLLSRLKGGLCDAASLDAALGDCDCSAVIMNLKKEQLINLLTD